MSEPQTRILKRPYFLLEGVSEVTEARYHGMKVGMPPICCVCRRGTDGPASGCAEAVCFECYELIRGKASYLRSLGNPPDSELERLRRAAIDLAESGDPKPWLIERWVKAKSEILPNIKIEDA